MRYMCIDVETTGLDFINDRVTELGWAIFDHDDPSPLLQGSHMVKQAQCLTQDIIDITGLTDAKLQEFGKPLDVVLEEFVDKVHQHKVEFFVGHNALYFDKPMLESEFDRCAISMPKRNWLDTKIDLPLTYKPKSTSLNYMLADHAKLNYYPHRAIFDALSCNMLLQEYDINKIVDVIKYPLVEIRAVVSYDQKDLARKQGYYWNQDRKSWMKSIRECYLQREKDAALGQFQVVVVS